MVSGTADAEWTRLQGQLGFSKTTHRKEDESLPHVLISMNVFIIVKKLKEPVAYGLAGIGHFTP
jgi:hypothetical protein